MQKIKLVAKLKKISDVASFVPLYLEGDALALYLEMNEEDQKSLTKIEDRLKEAFTDGPFAAYAKLNCYRWSGESIDVYASEIRRLAGLCGFVEGGLETMIKLAFVNGLPNVVAVELQQMHGMMKLAISDILTRARILVTNMASESTNFVNVATVRNSQQSRSEYVREKEGSRGRYKGKCFNCGGPHMVRQCEKRMATVEGKPREGCYLCNGAHLARNCPEKTGIVCYRCGKPGHISTNCQGNE